MNPIDKMFERLEHPVLLTIAAVPIVDVITEQALTLGIHRPFVGDFAARATDALFSTMPPVVEQMILQNYGVKRHELFAEVIARLCEPIQTNR